MKILHVIKSMDPKYGGPPELVLQLTVSLDNRGVAGEVVCLDDSDESHIVNSSIKIHALGGRDIVWALSLKLLPWLIRNSKFYDLVLVHSIWEYPLVAVYLASVCTGLKYWVFSHGALDPQLNNGRVFKKIKKSVYFPVFCNPALRRASDVFFTTEIEKKVSQSAYWPAFTKGVVVSAGTPGAPANLVNCKEKFQYRFPVVKNSRNILFLGRFVSKKGCDLLLRAFAQLIKHHSNLKLLMVGDDTDESASYFKEISIDLGVGEKILWTGLLVGDLKWGAYASAEVFVLPSHQENFGIAVAEALSCRVPVLISDKVNIADTVSKWNAGLVDIDTEEGTLRMLEKWASISQSDWNDYRIRAISCFTSNFHLDNFVTKVLEALDGPSLPKTDATKVK